MILVKSKIKCDVPPRFFRLLSSRCPPAIKPIVTILDSFSTVGENLALLLKQNPLIKELRLFDEEKNTSSLAQDLCWIDTQTSVISFSCRSFRDAIKGAHVVVSVGGHQSKTGETVKDLFHKNLDSVRNAAMFLAEFNPKAIFCIAKSPVEALVPMATEEYIKNETYNPRKIIGVTTYASMTANTLIAQHFNRDPMKVLCPVIGGMSANTTVPVLSQIRPKVELNLQVYTKLQEKAADMLNKGNDTSYGKVAAVARFVNLVLRGLLGDTKSVECAFVAQTGHIRSFLPFMTSIVKLGPDGVFSTHMPKISNLEKGLLQAAKPEIQKNILLGENFLRGGCAFFGKPKICDELLKEKVMECNKSTEKQLPN